MTVPPPVPPTPAAPAPASLSAARPGIPKFRRRADLLLATADGIAFVVVWLAAGTLTGTTRGPALTHALVTILSAAWWVGASWSVGGYDRQVLRAGWSPYRAMVKASSGFMVFALIARELAGPGTGISAARVFVAAWLLVLAGTAVRAGAVHGRRMLVPFGLGVERYAVVGTGEQARRLTGDLTRAAGAPFRLEPPFDADLPPRVLADRARELHLDGLILPDGYPAALAAELGGHLAPYGVDLLAEPGGTGRLDLLLANVAVLHGVPLLRARPLIPRRPAVRVRARDRTEHGVAILGTRGVPASYGGFETFAERLALHLVDRGVAPTVYCRTAYATGGAQWRGIRLVTLPTIQSKYLDTVVHTFVSALHLIVTGGPRDVVLCNAANAPVLLLLRAAGRRVVLNVDGLEWRRSKWGVAGRSWYRMGEWLSVRLASVLVTDAHEVRTYYRNRHDTDSRMIPYGADLLDRGSVPVPPETPDVAAGRYVLYVSRWEPENNPVMVAQAHAKAATGVPLVMLGKATYDPLLDRDVRAAAAPDAYLPGPVFGDGYWGLQSNALVYVHATQVGGTHPALIEALGAGNLVLVLDTPENREVVGDAARFFRNVEDLADLLRWATTISPAELDGWRAKARAHAAATYTWSTVGDAYLDLLGQAAPDNRSSPDGAGDDQTTRPLPALDKSWV